MQILITSLCGFRDRTWLVALVRGFFLQVGVVLGMSHSCGFQYCLVGCTFVAFSCGWNFACMLVLTNMASNLVDM